MKENLRETANMLQDFPERIFAGSVDLDAYLCHISRYIFSAQFTQRRLVLDVGCGTGYGSYYISRNGASIVGIDIDASAIWYARENYGSSRLALIVADATHLPLKKDSFGLVTSFETIEHVNNPSHLLLECYRVVDRGGLLTVSTPNSRRFLLGGRNLRNPFHKTEFTFEDFRKAIVQAGFVIEWIGAQGRIQLVRKSGTIGRFANSISRSLPYFLKKAVHLLQEVLFYGSSLRDALLYYRGKPREIAGGFSYRNLPIRHRVTYMGRKDNPDSHQTFVFVARKSDSVKSNHLLQDNTQTRKSLLYTRLSA